MSDAWGGMRTLLSRGDNLNNLVARFSGAVHVLVEAMWRQGANITTLLFTVPVAADVVSAVINTDAYSEVEFFTRGTPLGCAKNVDKC